MEGFMHWYNSHRRTIWILIGVAILVIIMINVINSNMTQNEKPSYNTSTDIKNTLNTISIGTDTSPISGDKITSGQQQTLKVIDNFVAYCNNGDISSAYGLVSSDCKNEMFKSEDVFKKIYYDIVFGGIEKEVSSDNWVNNTYKVKFMDNALATGNFDENNITQDYITVVKENNTIKLNINNYIEKQSINKSQEADNVKIKVVEGNTYFDYQAYVLEITNNRDTPIVINDPTVDSTMYIEDKNGTHYQAYTHELSEADKKIPAGETKKVTIKYFSKYSSNKIMKYVTFERIILDYGAYSHYTHIGAYRQYGSIRIEL